MARYGIDYYGKGVYGSPSVTSFNIGTFTATPVDYAKIYLSWSAPTGNWTGIRLLRSIYGFPETADDGTVLVDQTVGYTNATTTTSYYDPAAPEIPILPHQNIAIDPNSVRYISSWTGGISNFTVVVNDATYIATGSTINIYGETAVDGTWVVSSVSGNTITIATTQNEFNGQSGTSGYVYVNELVQGRFYYYSVFLKILTNTVTVTSATGNGTSITYTTANPHGFSVGNFVGIVNMENPSFNFFGVEVVSTTPYTFTIYSNTTGTSASSSSVTATVGINTQWVRVGNASGLSVKDYGSQYKLYDYLPNIYKVSNTELGIDNPENSTLRSFLGMFGFYYDLLKTYADLVGKRNQIDKLAGTLIPAALQQFNFNYEPELGFKRMRSLISNAIHIYQSKGSYQGTIDYIKALTGNSSKVVQGKNLFLDSSDSSFEVLSTDSPSGRWVVNNGTLAGSVAVPITSWSTSGNTITVTCVYNSKNSSAFATGSSVYIKGSPSIDGAYTSGVVVSTVTNTIQQVNTLTVTITTVTGNPTASGTTGYLYAQPVLPYSETGNPMGVANAIQGLGILTTSNGVVSASCGASNAVGQGIPVTSSLSYTFSYQVYSVTATNSFFAGISWYDYRGNFISTNTSTGTTSSKTAWTKVSVSATAPSNAYFAVPNISLTDTSTHVHYVDACQLEQSSSATYYQDARQIQVYVQPNRINLAAYSDFDYGILGGWSASNATIDIATGEGASPTSGNTLVSPNMAETYSTGTSQVTITYASSTGQYIPVNGSSQYTYSAQLITSNDNNPSVGVTAQLAIDWYDSSYNLISTSYTQPAVTPMDPANSQYFYLTDSSPASAVYANLHILWTPPGAGYGLRFGGVIFENQPFFINYFNGDWGYAEDTDISWAGTVGQSASYYYKNKVATNAVLNNNLASFLPYGSNFAVYYQAM